MAKDWRLYEEYQPAELGAWLVRCRTALGWRQADLARRAGLHRSSLWAAERGLRSLPPEPRRRLVGVLMDGLTKSGKRADVGIT